MSANREKDSLHGLVKELYVKTVTLTGKDKDIREEFPILRFARYDEAGNKVEEAHFNSDDSLVFKTVWTYDSAGKLVEQVNFDANESPTFKTTFEYDLNGRLTEKKTFGSDGSLEDVLRPNYTAEGLRIEKKHCRFPKTATTLTVSLKLKELICFSRLKVSAESKKSIMIKENRLT